MPLRNTGTLLMRKTQKPMKTTIIVLAAMLTACGPMTEFFSGSKFAVGAEIPMPSVGGAAEGNVSVRWEK
jgi:hypothetical protein